MSNFGRVRSKTRHVTQKSKGGSIATIRYNGKVMRIQRSRNGYWFVCLYKNRVSYHAGIHRLVAKAFVPGYRAGLEVNHIDECKENNRADNLEWVSPKENINKSTRLKLYLSIKRKPVNQISIQGEFIRRWTSIDEASRELGLTRSHIRNVCKNKSGYKSAGGYRWRFADD